MRIAMMVMLLVGPSLARADEAAAVETARSWLGALREKNPTKLKNASGLPFTEAGIGPGTGKCGKRAKAADAASFGAAADCMIADREFGDSVPPMVEAHAVALKAIDNPTFKKNLKSLAPLQKDHSFVIARLTGDALQFEVLLAVRKTAVTLVLVESKPLE